MEITQDIQRLALLAVPFFLGITCHEFAHGYVSMLFGDPTAKNAGRLTLNPLKHLDPIGTLALIVTQMIGWAKPVPIDPRYYRNPRQGILLVSLAGPVANILLAILFYLFYHSLLSFGEIFSPHWQQVFIVPLAAIAVYGVMVNVMLGIFNLIPIPPLDGSKIMACLLPPKAAASYMRLERYGFLIILGLALLKVFQRTLGVAAAFIYQLLF